ncbi:MAG: hypothetical protein AM324_005615 [Candidatus Thorarchaeota archaeon SMTZ1-83]|nr:MAG: hypothetical protein AM324_06855 [Candidatus Thorarchaeota archaeon SMTZ1-83]
MNWLAKIVNGNADEFSHAKLVKYGIGTHPGPRAKVKLSKNSITFKADLDYEKLFIRAYLKGAPEGAHKVRGVIRTYADRSEEFSSLMMPLIWKRSKGKTASIFNAKVDDPVPLDDIKAVVDTDDPTTFFLLSLSPRDGTKPWKVTTKTSFPKSGPKEDDDEGTQKDPTFTKGSLGNTAEVFDYTMQELLPDLKDKVGPKTKNILIQNTIVVEDIVPPDDPGLSFSEKRKLAKKRGRIVRNVTIDDNEYDGEYEFLV